MKVMFLSVIKIQLKQIKNIVKSFEIKKILVLLSRII